MKEKELAKMEEIMSEKIIQWRKWLQIIIIFFIGCDYHYKQKLYNKS